VGFARANNQAIQSTKSRYVLLLNSDAFPTNDAIAKLLAAMEHDEAIAVAGPRMYDGNGDTLASAHAFETLTRLAVTAFSVHKLMPASLQRIVSAVLGRAGVQHLVNYEASVPTDVDWVSGACMMLRRAAIDRVGSLDERYFMYMEDEDWCRRFRERGYRVVYVPDGEVAHFVAQSASNSLGRALAYRKSRLLYHRRYHRRVFPALWILSSIYAARQCVMDWLAGWRGRWRLRQ